MNIKIKKATPKDIGGIITMIKQICDYERKLDKYYKPFSKYKDLDKAVTKSLKDKNTIVIVAKSDKQIIGYGESTIEKAPNYVFTSNKIGFIGTIIINSKHRGRGVGKKILNELLKWLKSKKVKNIELEVNAYNDIGIAFWKNNNFFTYRLKMRRDL